MNFKYILVAAALALAGTTAVSSSADAFSLKRLARGVERTASKAVKGVTHTVAHDVKGVGHFASSAAKSVGHEAGNIAKATPKIYLAVARPVGRAVASYYQYGARQIEKTPFKVLAPLARDAARAALSKSGKFGAAIGVGAAVLTGGGSLVYAAGRGAITGYYAEKGVGIAKRAYHQGVGEVRTTVRQIGAAAR